MIDPSAVRIICPEGADLDRPGVYRWLADGQTYVGKASNLRSRLNEYLRNLRKIEMGQPCRKSKPEGFRSVHRHLAKAKATGAVLEWEVLEFCAKGAPLLMRERHWIRFLAPTLNGPPKGPLNE